MRHSVSAAPNVFRRTGGTHPAEYGLWPIPPYVNCTLTGHGLKDPDTAIKQGTGPLHKVKAELGAVKKAILDNLPR